MTTEWLRFWKKVAVEGGSGCWLWTAAKYSNGYGAFYPSGKPRRSALAHRYAYRHLIGEVPDGLDLDHLCRVRNCVNPAHLEPVTRSENLLRKPKRQTVIPAECKNHHAMTSANTYLPPGGSWACKECRRNQKKAARLNASPEQRAALRARDAELHRDRRTRERGGLPARPNGMRTHCPQGHPLSGDNLYAPPSGSRKCRTCIAGANRRAYLKRAAAKAASQSAN